MSAVTALGIDRAARERRVVDLEPVWERLGQTAAPDPGKRGW